MSFSREVKLELTAGPFKARHCQLAELAGIILTLGSIKVQGGDECLWIRSEDQELIERVDQLLRKLFKIETRTTNQCTKSARNRRLYYLYIDSLESIESIAKGLHFERPMKEQLELGKVPEILLLHDCCIRAYIRGCFVSGGSISDPKKNYHLEIVLSNRMKALQLIALLGKYQVEGKVVLRKNHYVVYIKDGDGIVDLLSLVGAYTAVMAVENARILKDVRNTVNRKVNCETANINKTVSAAVRQIGDINLIKEQNGLDDLTPALRQMAEIRIAYPELALKELGQMLNPPVGKSGVNHRLRKLSDIAQEIRK